jgi:hypothetical protein
MDLIEQINRHESLLLVDLNRREPGDEPTGLRLVVDEARRMSSSEKASWDEIGIVDPITSEGTRHRYQIFFFECIAYFVRDGIQIIFEDEDDYDVSTGGRLFKTCSKSHFLDCARATTLAKYEAMGPFTHYRITCFYHVIDVLARDAPVITSLSRA